MSNGPNAFDKLERKLFEYWQAEGSDFIINSYLAETEDWEGRFLFKRTTKLEEANIVYVDLTLSASRITDTEYIKSISTYIIDQTRILPDNIEGVYIEVCDQSSLPKTKEIYYKR